MSFIDDGGTAENLQLGAWSANANACDAASVSFSSRSIRKVQATLASLERSNSQLQPRPAGRNAPIRKSQSVRINKIAVASATPKQASSVSPVQERFQDLEELANPKLAERRSSTLQIYRGLIDRNETAQLCDLLGMTYNDVRKLNTQFAEEDTENTNTITQQSFFYLIGEERSELTKALFRLAKMPPSQPRLSFDEYLLVVCSFASFSKPEVLKFFFDVYTSEPILGTAPGTMVENDIAKLGNGMQALQSAFSNNIKLATKRMTTNRDVVTAQTVLTFDDFERLSKQHMVAFFPLVKLQLNVRERTLGKRYWTQRMRENQAVQRLLAHMNRHHGLLPRLPWKDWFVRLIFNYETFVMRVRAQAKRIYAKQHRQRQAPKAREKD